MDRIRQHNTGDNRRDRATPSNLNPWDGYRIPKVSEDFPLKKPRDFIRSAWDSTLHQRRPQRVNMQIDTFNEHLGKITGDYGDIINSKILSKEQHKQCIDQVIIISKEFERYSHEAIKDYGKIPRLNHDERENAFRELERLNNVIQEMYEDWNKVKQIDSDITEISSKYAELLSNRPYIREKCDKMINRITEDVKAYYDYALNNYNKADFSLELIMDNPLHLVPIVSYPADRGRAWEELNEPIKLLREYMGIEQEYVSLKQWFQDYTNRPIENPQLQATKDTYDLTFRLNVTGCLEVERCR